MGADFLNKFNKTIYYIEGLDLMVGEVDDINKYNLMMSVGNVYDDLEDAIKAIITKIDNYIKVNEKMINEFKSAIKDQEYIKFDLTSKYTKSIKHLKNQIEKYQTKRSYYEKLL